MRRRNRRKLPSRKSNTYNFYGIIAVFLFIVVLVFPSLALLLTNGFRNSDSTANLPKATPLNPKNTIDNSLPDDVQIPDNPNKTKVKEKDILPPNDNENPDNSISTQDTIPAISKNIKSKLTFKSTLKVLVKEQNKIVSLPIEEYIKGVVAAEMPANFDVEALKAQAVAARTYTYMVLNKNKNGCPYNKDADITDSYKEYQAYIPKETRISLWPKNDANALWNKVSKAVDDTKGQIMFYKNNIIYAAFHSSSFQKTEDGSAITDKSLPYLKSVSSPDSSLGKSITDKFVINKTRLNTLLSKYDKNYKSLPIKNTMTKIKVLSRTPGGRINRIQINNIVLTGVALRKILNLKSTNFSIGENASQLVFNVTGYGHGMGMSQYGAYAMALQGNTYQQILKHYYTGITLMKAY